MKEENGKEEKVCNANILTSFHGEQRENWAVKLLYHVRNQKFQWDFCNKLYILIRQSALTFLVFEQ